MTNLSPDSRDLQVLSEASVPYSAERVFAILRDRIEDLATHMETIEKITVVDRSDINGRIVQRSHWQPSQRSLPTMIRPFIRSHWLNWDDIGEWDPERLLCAWRLQPLWRGGIFSCSGTTSVTPDGDSRCTFRVRGALRLHLERLPGLPKALARRANAIAGRFVVRSMQPNLLAAAVAVERYLADADEAQRAGRCQ